MEKEIAVIMAAGLGSRMRPLTETIPKPLIPIHNVTMIETVLAGLHSRGITEIYIVVGYLKEQFLPLCSKYPGVVLIENSEYESKNNISSIYAARNVIRSANCFICEADLYVKRPEIFQGDFLKSGYFAKFREGYSDDWIFEVDENNRIWQIRVGGENKYNMAGISYFLKEDANKVADAIEQAYRKPGHETCYWDEIVNQQLTELELTIYPLEEQAIIEIDTVEELNEVILENDGL